MKIITDKGVLEIPKDEKILNVQVDGKLMLIGTDKGMWKVENDKLEKILEVDWKLDGFDLKLTKVEPN